jgi:hypothetical protein
MGTGRETAAMALAEKEGATEKRGHRHRIIAIELLISY